MKNVVECILYYIDGKVDVDAIIVECFVEEKEMIVNVVLKDDVLESMLLKVIVVEVLVMFEVIEMKLVVMMFDCVDFGNVVVIGASSFGTSFLMFDEFMFVCVMRLVVMY